MFKELNEILKSAILSHPQGWKYVYGEMQKKTKFYALPVPEQLEISRMSLGDIQVVCDVLGFDLTVLLGKKDDIHE